MQAQKRQVTCQRSHGWYCESGICESKGKVKAVILDKAVLPASQLSTWGTVCFCLGCGSEYARRGRKGLTGSQFSSVAQSCPTLYNPMDCGTPGFPVHQQLSELTQTHVQWVGDVKQSNPLSSPSAFNLSQHQGLFQLVSSSHQVAKGLGVSASASVFPMNIQDWSIGLTGGQFPLNQPIRREKEILAWFWKPRPLATMPSLSMSSGEQFLLWGRLNLCLPSAGTKKVKVAQSCLESLQPHGLDSPWNSPDQDTGVSSLSLLQGIFLTQGSNLGLLHCRQILY